MSDTHRKHTRPKEYAKRRPKQVVVGREKPTRSAEKQALRKELHNGRNS